MKQAIVTGAGGGLGFSICKSLSENNFSVAAVDLNLTDSEKTSDKLNNTKPYAADVRDEESIISLYEKIDNTPDLIVNNAGIARFGKLFDQKLSDFQDVVQTNLIGSFIVATEGAKRMVKEDKKGSIINITSINSSNPGPRVGAYSASKLGLYSLTKLMALEWGEYGIRVNAIAPGFTDAGMSKPIYKNPNIRNSRGKAVPLQRLGSAEDIANTVLFLASEEASYINANEIVVDGGVIHSVLMHLPRE